MGEFQLAINAIKNAGSTIKFVVQSLQTAKVNINLVKKFSRSTIGEMLSKEKNFLDVL